MESDTGNFLAQDIFKLGNPSKYKLHLACKSHDGINPLDVYVNNHIEWKYWNQWRGNRNDWTRDYIFSLIEFYPKPDTWLFGGIFKVLERNSDGYKLEYVREYSKYEGRVLLSFHRYQGMRGRAFFLNKYYDKFYVSEVLARPFDGINFPGYQNINCDFNSLEVIIRNEKLDWKTALVNMKGVYLITDKSNGKKYVGSAYGDSGIWSRWACYIGTGHGWNDQLTKLIKSKGIQYARNNFKFALMEVMLMTSSDNYILERESYWKNVLLSREFGYNKN